MRSYQTFAFVGCGFDAAARRITLRYALEPKKGPAMEFTETIDLPKEGLRSRGIDSELLNRAIRLLHLLGGVSYFKTSLPPEIDVRTETLSQEESAFLTTVYEEGLGELFFVNDISPRDKVRFPAGSDVEREAGNLETGKERVLVPFGGGKDSVVTAQMLKDAGIPVTLFRMNPHPAIDRLAEAMQLPVITVTRTLDPKLLELNRKGALNGHVPITAYVHALSLVVAMLYRCTAVAFSNERSANIGSTVFHGKEINHQWSKGLTFERMFQDIIRTTITPDIPVFSLLRPWSELMIVRKFSELPPYHALATSCNENWKLTGAKNTEGLWCGQCPKCAFAFAMFAAWLPATLVISMVGTNCFAAKTMLKTYRELLGIDGIKPLECVGTPDEVKAAFLLAHARNEWEGSAAMRMFVKDVLPQIDDQDALLQSVLSPVPEHAIPPSFTTVIPERPPITLH